MASSSGKRLKTMATKRKEKEPEQPHSSRFLSRKHEKHFRVVQDRRLLMERKVGMIPNFAPQFGEQVLGNDWGKLATYPAPANIVVYWMAFSHANIQPCSHVSDITLSRALFIYCAIRNLNVNIGQVIADDISVCVNTSNNKAPLGHPSLITHLCKIAGVDTSAPPFERPRKAIDEAYYRQYCGGEEAAQPVPPRRARAQLQSIHRGQVATAEMIVGMYDTPPAHRWTMDEFHNVVAWPEEPVQREEAEAAKASVREMEEDEADDDDAFEDAEDEEEEEDKEDSSD
ncbi:hypothetical protein LR48_Vigan463s002300 [Vigna angularis]|uniref:Putative plant transposon protein domain-containing protein n=1 Tax=Phaseolus angularis TaxID=3914 RepID=A0A0L9TBL7_PHAAN|nr:hypothetical protein LR48_Vigan463s002300 [Vigna angularis]